MEQEKLDIVELIEKNPITRLNKEYNDKYIKRIKNTFNNVEQQLFLSSFYCYLNHDQEKDFVIELGKIWKWLGFTRIDHCKTVLKKHFVENIDYKILLQKLQEKKMSPPKAAPEVGGAGSDSINVKNLGGAGLNKETILLNIKTFKKLCLKSNTKKADSIHDYFIRLEEMLYDILVEEASELQTQLQLKESELQETSSQLNVVKQDSVKHKHNILLREYSYECNLVYLIKVKTFQNNTFVLKIGESRMGILNRYKEHKTKYPECLILDCFLVKRSKQFEKFLHWQLNKHLYKTLLGHENETELFLVGEELSYNYILKLIHDNVNEYDDDKLEINKYKLEIQKLKLENENLRLHKCEKNSLDYNKLLNDIRYIVKDEVSKVRIQSVTNNFSEQLATLGPYVQQFNPDTLTLIKVFQSISEVCKAYKVPRSSLVKAAKENTIYCNYRWNLVDRKENPNVVTTIQPTKLLQKVQNLGYIAKLSHDKCFIVNVYLDRKTASIKNGYNTVSFLDSYVKNGNLIDGHYYTLYDSCENDLKLSFLQKNNLTNVVLYKSGGVGQYDLNNNLIKEFRSKYDCQSQIQIGNKSLCKALETGKSYNDCFYKYLNDKLFI
jgi:hypothetical protein